MESKVFTVDEKQVVFKSFLCEEDTWGINSISPEMFTKITHIGHCNVQGDLFAAHHVNGNIFIYTGEFTIKIQEK